MSSSAPALIPTVKDRGISMIAEPSQGNAAIDVVFVHGLNGHPQTTWQHESTGFLWPWELRNVLKQARIMVFGYDADIKTTTAKNLMGIHDHAVSLLGRVRNERAGFPANKRPLIFICHSLGGLVVKEALITSATDPNFKVVYLATKAVFFFGTPHRGAVALSTKRMRFLINIGKLASTGLPGDLETALQTRSKELFTINNQFRNIDLLQNNALSITCFFERIQTVGLGDVVVDQDSATLGYTSEEDVGLAVDHRGLVRFISAEDDNYDFISKTILSKMELVLSESGNEQASLQLLGSFGGRMRLREQQKIPYLTWMNWFQAWPSIGASWGGGLQIGTTRLGRYRETWMNLLLVFGAESIIRSAFIEELPINLDEVPPGVNNPFAIELGVAAILAGLAGCDTMVLDRNIPTFRSETSTLAFSAGGPFTMVGHFSQEPTVPTYMSQAPRTVAMATGFAGGSFFYRASEPTPGNVSHASTMPNPLLFHDLRGKACHCENSQNTASVTAHQRTGLRVHALALLAADTPSAGRVFPTQKLRTLETVREIARHCNYWKNDLGALTLRSFNQKLSPAINTIVPFFQLELAQTPFQGDRFEMRLITLARAGSIVKFVDLGFSWLASTDDYQATSNAQVKVRPDWPIEVGSSGLVVIEGMIEACSEYLRSGREGLMTHQTQEAKALFHVCTSCQLQEVDWWLGTRQSVAACETGNLFNAISPSNCPAEARDYTRQQTSSSTLVIFNERRAVRAILVFRALLIAVLLGLGLDNSALDSTELGNIIVLLR